MTAFDSSKTTVARNVPTPTPRPEVSTPVSQPKPETAPSSTPASDQTSFSKESQEVGGAANAPVNFSAWDSPSEATGATEASATDISALGSGLLKKGARGEEVEALQKMLNERTGSNLDVDGKFGNDTLKVLKQFQESQGLKADGIVGKDTRSAFSSQDSTAAAPGAAAAAEGAAPEQGGEAAAPEQGAQEATEQAEAAGQTAAAEQAAEGQDGAPVQEGAQTEGSAEAGETEATSAIPGTEDTSWTEKLPKGLQPHAQAFVDAGKKYGVDPRFLAAISMQETGNGTSYSMRKRNNAMGIMKGSKHRTFKTVADSINSQANSLTRDGGYYTGKTSIAQIGATYAPIGAKNDPNNLNRHWVPNISRNFEMLGGDASGQVKGFEVNG